MGGDATFGVITQGTTSSVNDPTALRDAPGLNDEDVACAYWLQFLQDDVEDNL